MMVRMAGAMRDVAPGLWIWRVDHPGWTPVEHRCGATGIDWVEVGGDADQLAAWLGPHDLPLRPVGGPAGPRRVALAVDEGEPVVIG